MNSLYLLIRLSLALNPREICNCLISDSAAAIEFLMSLTSASVGARFECERAGTGGNISVGQVLPFAPLSGGFLNRSHIFFMTDNSKGLKCQLSTLISLKTAWQFKFSYQPTDANRLMEVEQVVHSLRTAVIFPNLEPMKVWWEMLAVLVGVATSVWTMVSYLQKKSVRNFLKKMKPAEDQTNLRDKTGEGQYCASVVLQTHWGH